jgi:hypothetical protein
MSFTRVSKADPCPICRRAGLRGIDWCRVFDDGWVECMRVQSDKPAKSGGWMHRLSGGEGGARSGERSRSHPTGQGQPPVIDAAKLMREWTAATSATALAEFAAALGVSAPSVVAVGAAWAAPYSAWAFPMCDGYGSVVGIRLRNERGKFAVRGSRQGIFTTTDHGPGTTGPQRTLFVCEGPTDTAAAVELGLFAVGRPNCCCGGPEIKVFARRQGCSRVVVVSDNDKPGLDGARKVGREVKLPFAVYVPPAKDLREFVRLGGTRAMIENTVKGIVWQG